MENNYQALFNCKFITNEDGVALFIDGKNDTVDLGGVLK